MGNPRTKICTETQIVLHTHLNAMAALSSAVWWKIHLIKWFQFSSQGKCAQVESMRHLLKGRMLHTGVFICLCFKNIISAVDNQCEYIWETFDLHFKTFTTNQLLMIKIFNKTTGQKEIKFLLQKRGCVFAWESKQFRGCAKTLGRNFQISGQENKIQVHAR